MEWIILKPIHVREHRHQPYRLIRKPSEMYLCLVEWTPDRIEMFVRLNDADQNETSILVLERQNRDWKFW